MNEPVVLGIDIVTAGLVAFVVLLVLALFMWAVDTFVGFAERDDEVGGASPGARRRELLEAERLRKYEEARAAQRERLERLRGVQRDALDRR
ncbi:MAG TPA: hypothetical protein VM364_07930 [Vicinamibacterales bacterium]|nr:hypothetical protein [Vicinamibacterales bacterium]